MRRAASYTRLQMIAAAISNAVLAPRQRCATVRRAIIDACG